MEYNNKNNNTKYEKEVVNLFGTQIHEVSADEMSVPLVFIDRDKLNTQHFYLFCKRCFDIVVSVIGGASDIIGTTRRKSLFSMVSGYD